MSSTPTQKQSNNLPGNDPLMGQLEVIEPGIAMFHGFANVAFAYGRGEMIVVDTSSRRDGRAGGARDSRGQRGAVRVYHLYAWPRRSRVRHRGVHQRRDHARACAAENLGAGECRRPLQALRADPRMAVAYQSAPIRRRVRDRRTVRATNHSATPTWFIAINNFSTWWESRSSCIMRWARRTTRPGSGCRRGGSRWSAI